MRLLLNVIFALVLPVCQMSNLWAIDRNSAIHYVFTAEVMKVDRTSGQMILQYSEGGKSVIAKNKMLRIVNYDRPEMILTVRIIKVHEAKPLIIVKVKSGELSQIEDGFRFRTEELDGIQKPTATPAASTSPSPSPASTTSPSPTPKVQ